MTRRRYTRQQKMAAVAEATVNGTEQASVKTGIPRTTILYWLDRPEFVELRNKTREELSDGFKALAHLALTRLMEAINSGDVEPRDLSVALGIATDKHLLMSGEATGRTETRTWTDALDPDKQRKLRDWALERLDELDRRTDDAQGDAQGAGVREPAAG